MVHVWSHTPPWRRMYVCWCQRGTLQNYHEDVSHHCERNPLCSVDGDSWVNKASRVACGDGGPAYVCCEEDLG